MATTADFVGTNCPFCGALDSLETDDVLGEVACTECAKVVAMGLEENALTRYDKDATYDDVDRHAAPDDGPGGPVSKLGVSGSSGLSRSSAAALAAGVITNRNAGTEAQAYEKYARTNLHPRMRQHLEYLCRIARRNEDVLSSAVRIAKHFIGYRRERGEKVMHLMEISAACFMIATEQSDQPVPLAELRTIDPSLKDIESRRAEVVRDTKMEAEEDRLRAVFAPNLVRHYIRLLHLPMARYESACMDTLSVLRNLETTSMAQLIEAERVLAAVLLVRTEATPLGQGAAPSPRDESSDSGVFAEFAAVAHLNLVRVKKVMAIVLQHRDIIHSRLKELAEKRQSAATSRVGAKHVRSKEEYAPPTAMVKHESP